jgi:hypothetical protein
VTPSRPALKKRSPSDHYSHDRVPPQTLGKIMNLRHTLAVIAVLFATSISRADDVASAALAEVTSQKTKTFDVGDARFRGPTNFQIRYPASWGTSESARQGVVARIASANGEGMDSLVIVVNRGDPKIKNPTPDSVFTPGFLAKFALAGSTVVRKERLKVGSFDGAVFEYFFEQSRPPMKVRTFVTNYIFTQNGALVQLQFYVLLGEKAEKAADEARISAFRPVWEAMLTTMELK